MRLKILNKFWGLVYQTFPKGQYGKCDAPDVTNKKIGVGRSLRGQHFLEIMLHETHHAADWYKDEEWIHDVAADQARIICRPEILQRLLDSPELLERAKDTLAKHGYVKQ